MAQRDDSLSRRSRSHVVLSLGKARLALYSVVLIVVVVGITGTSYLKSRYVHDYSKNRTPRPELLVLTADSVNDALHHAFAFMPANKDGKEPVTFRSGMCLLAYRHTQGEAITMTDKLVQAAVVKLWQHPWMQAYSNRELQQIWDKHAGSAGNLPLGAETLDRMRDEYVHGLVNREGFESEFKALLMQTAREFKQKVEWKEED